MPPDVREENEPDTKSLACDKGGGNDAQTKGEGLVRKKIDRGLKDGRQDFPLLLTLIASFALVQQSSPPVR